MIFIASYSIIVTFSTFLKRIYWLVLWYYNAGIWVGIYIQVSQHMGSFLCVLGQLFYRSYFIRHALSNSVSATTSSWEETEESLRKCKTRCYELCFLLYKSLCRHLYFVTHVSSFFPLWIRTNVTFILFRFIKMIKHEFL